MFLLFSLLLSYSHADCPVHARAVFDVGSGATKMAVALIEVCPGEIHVRRFLDESSSLDVPLEGSKNAEGDISAEALARLTEALKSLKAKAENLVREQAPEIKELEVGAAGTHAVRTAKNISDLVKAAQRAGIPLTTLTQTQEGLNGFAGARAKGLQCPPGAQVLVWDVGGGSQQWILADGRVFGLPLGAESFKAELVTVLKRPVQARCEAKAPSPNPLGPAGREHARALAQAEAQRLPEALRGLKDLCLVGIGGVHTKAIAAALEKNWKQVEACTCPQGSCAAHLPHHYSARELNCLADLFAKKGDCDSEIRGPYASTNVSNLFMIAGFLKVLGATNVQTLNVNMGHGLAVDQKLIRFQTERL
jgi:exopolyphosphatase/guanosine-5'-triphosphate,3'-diphosphate pyrophosphatase